MLGITIVNVAQAATSPSIGTLGTYGVVSETFTNSLNTGLETAIIGDVCYTIAPTTAPISISGITVVPCPPAVGTEQNTALSDLNAQAADLSCTNIGPAPALNAVDIDGAGPLSPGTFTPGCYKSDTSMSITLGTTVTLDGGGTYIFKSGGALTTGANSQVVAINGASACDIFWIPTGATTLGANSSTSASPTFLGNIFRGDAGGLSITLGHFVNLTGRLFAFGSTVTTDSNTITVPTCTPPVVAPILTVTKDVINDNEGTKVIANFPLFLDGISVVSGVASTTTIGLHTVSETADSGYTATISGDCLADGTITLVSGDTKSCTITNNDIAPVVPPSSGGGGQFSRPPTTSPVLVTAEVSTATPVINVIKIPSIFVLPVGGGMVTYTKLITNPGIVGLSNIRLADDKCTPVNYVSGDVNLNSKLDITETWIYTCETLLSRTTTNTVTASGEANGLTANDSALATVLVSRSTPILPSTGLSPQKANHFEENVKLLDIFGMYSTMFKTLVLENIVQAIPKTPALRIRIPKIGVNAVLKSTGLTPQGAMGVPLGPEGAVWFDEGPKPGEIGSSVVAGHSGWGDNEQAVFDDLYKLKTGDRIFLENEEGKTSTYVVREVRVYGEDDEAPEVFSSDDSGAHINLITCAGIWNEEKQTSSDRLVVFTDKI